MKRIAKRLPLFFLAAVQCLFCYGETKDEIIELYARYRAVRSQAQLPYIRSPSSEPVITEEMKRFYLNGTVDTLMFHAYEPKAFVVEDDFECLRLEDDGAYQGDGFTGKSYFLHIGETIIEEIHNGKRQPVKKRKEDFVWILETDGSFYILGDASLSDYYVCKSDLRKLQGQ